MARKGKKSKKGDSQLFSYSELVKNNKDIFSKTYMRHSNEPDSHYICKILCGELLRKYCGNGIDIRYERELPPLAIDGGKGIRTYQQDILVKFIDTKNEKVHIADIEINGGIHYKNKERYRKNKLRRETIWNYYNSLYRETGHENYKIVLGYIVFEPDEFLYNKFDYFFNIFNDKFMNGGIHPEVDAYEKYFLK